MPLIFLSPLKAIWKIGYLSQEIKKFPG